MEHVEGVGDLGDAGLRVEEGGERCEETVGERVTALEGGAVFVAAAGKLRCLQRVFLEAWPWRSDRKDSGLDTKVQGESSVCFFGPWRYVPPGRISACIVER